MRVLLDENLDHALRRLLGHHEVVTVAYMGWTGLKNGELLQTAESNGIDVLLTGDGRSLTSRTSLDDVLLSSRFPLFSYPSSNSI